MNTIKDLAIKWWESLDEIYATKLIVKYYPLSVIDYEKIENIFYQEVILKWYVGKYGKVEFDYNEKEIRNIYIKEHTKEQPQSVDNTIDVEEHKCKYCGAMTIQPDEDCYAAPKAIEDDVWDEARKEYHKLYSVKSMSGLDILTIPQRHLFKWLEQHYSLTKKQ